MELSVVIAIVLAVPVILFPVAFVWYLNIGGIIAALREKRKATRKAAETHAKAHVVAS
jgi:hypothetical protein